MMWTSALRLAVQAASTAGSVGATGTMAWAGAGGARCRGGGGGGGTGGEGADPSAGDDKCGSASCGTTCAHHASSRTGSQMFSPPLSCQLPCSAPQAQPIE